MRKSDFCIWFILVSLLISCDRSSNAPEIQGSVVALKTASLQDPISEVKARRAKELVWKSAPNGEALFDRDALQTGKESSGVVVFNDQVQIRLEELSFLVIDASQVVDAIHVSNVVLPSGKLHATLQSSEQHPVRLIVKTKKGWVRAESRSKAQEPSIAPVKVSVEVSREGLRVAAVTGRLTVQSQEGEKNLIESQTVLIPSTAEEKKSWTPAGESLDLRTEPETKASNPVFYSDAETLPTGDQKVWGAAKIEPIAPSPANTDKPKVASTMESKFLIESPKSKSVIKTDEVQISGILQGDLQVFFQGKKLSQSEVGKFKIKVPLNPGANLFTFQVIETLRDDSSFGTKADKAKGESKKVRYETLEIQH